MAGIDLTRQLRLGHLGGAGTRILAITAHADDSAGDLALSAGADQFIARPFTMDQLLEQTRSLAEYGPG
jgi:DNA-binding response OmpR family regulator